MFLGRRVMASTPRRVIDLSFRLNTRPARFLLVGITGVAVSTGVLWIATRGAGLSTVWGGVLASVTSTFTNFLLNDAFTWRDKRRAGLRQKVGRLIRYYITTGAGNLIYLGVLAGLVHWLRLFDLAANLVAIGIGGMFNYLLHNAWTWRGGSRPVDGDA